MIWKPVVLAILDGWGLSDSREGNAPLLARTPNFDRLMQTCPNARLSASGPDVGLPEGQMGNSEVGHITIGAGRVIWMDLPRIDRAIADGSYGERPAMQRFVTRMQETGGTAHLLGVMSTGGVHGHQAHIATTANLLTRKGIPVALHLLLDGRDTAPQSAQGYLAMLTRAAAPALAEGARIATVCGRFFAMDRDHRWDRVERAYRVVVEGQGREAPDAATAIGRAYARGETDEFVEPTRIGDYGGMRESGDGIFCLNFRADRAREIMGALCDPAFDGFARHRRVEFAARLGMAPYSDHLSSLLDTVFPADPVPHTLGACVAGAGRRQFRLAETEKYPHVTFFLNGGVEEPAAGEDRVMPASPKVATYDLAPEMAAGEVTEHLVRAVGEGYDLIVVNFANPDMVGHTGDLGAAIRACEAVDHGLGAGLEAVARAGGAMLVTADHGNCEMMIDPRSGGPHTAHTLNPVPVALAAHGSNAGLGLRSGRLSDIAPTLLELMAIQPPTEMTGRSLILRGAG